MRLSKEIGSHKGWTCKLYSPRAKSIIVYIYESHLSPTTEKALWRLEMQALAFKKNTEYDFTLVYSGSERIISFMIKFVFHELWF